MKTRTRIGYKLFRKRKNGTYGSLFINRKKQLHINNWYKAEEHNTPGFSFRPGWHICHNKSAPHLSEKDRVWCLVKFFDYKTIVRPEAQGGIWHISRYMKILSEVETG